MAADSFPVTADGGSCQRLASSQIIEISGCLGHELAEHGAGDSLRDSSGLQQARSLRHQSHHRWTHDKRGEVIEGFHFRSNGKRDPTKLLDPSSCHSKGTWVAFEGPKATTQVSYPSVRTGNGLKGMERSNGRTPQFERIEDGAGQRSTGVKHHLAPPAIFAVFPQSERGCHLGDGGI